MMARERAAAASGAEMEVDEDLLTPCKKRAKPAGKTSPTREGLQKFKGYRLRDDGRVKLLTGLSLEQFQDLYSEWASHLAEEENAKETSMNKFYLFCALRRLRLGAPWKLLHLDMCHDISLSEAKFRRSVMAVLKWLEGPMFERYVYLHQPKKSSTV